MITNCISCTIYLYSVIITTILFVTKTNQLANYISYFNYDAWTHNSRLTIFLDRDAIHCDSNTIVICTCPQPTCSGSYYNYTCRSVVVHHQCTIVEQKQTALQLLFVIPMH